MTDERGPADPEAHRAGSGRERRAPAARGHGDGSLRHRSGSAAPRRVSVAG